MLPDDLESRQHTVVGSLPSPQLNAQLTAAAEKAENDVFERYESTIRSRRLYHHALAYHSRDAEFKRKVSRTQRRPRNE